MCKDQKLQLGAAVFVFLSILCSLLSNQANSKLMGQAAMGVGVWAPTKGSVEWKHKEGLKTQVDGYFYVGVAFALLGLVLEILSILVDRKVGSSED